MKGYKLITRVIEKPMVSYKMSFMAHPEYSDKVPNKTKLNTRSVSWCGITRYLKAKLVFLGSIAKVIKYEISQFRAMASSALAEIAATTTKYMATIIQRDIESFIRRTVRKLVI